MRRGMRVILHRRTARTVRIPFVSTATVIGIECFLTTVGDIGARIAGLMSLIENPAATCYRPMFPLKTRECGVNYE